MRRPADETDGAQALPPLHLITTLAALRAVSDDQRHRMLSLLIVKPATARTLAARLRMSRTKVYYHLDLLERQGLIRVVGQRVSGRQLERVYRSVARAFRVDSSLLEGKTRRGAASARVQIFRNAVRDFEAVAGEPSSRPEHTVVSRVLLRLKPAQLAQLRERLVAIISGLDTTQGEGDAAELVIALFPTEF